VNKSGTMKRVSAAALCLLLLVCGADALSAQSGRRKTVRSTEKTSDSATSTPHADASAAGSEADAQSGAQGETVEGDVVRVETTLVTVPVSVRDRDGRYAPDLRREDFHIFEEGVEQRIAYFATVDQPFTVALVLDTSGSTDLRLDDMQEAAIAFVSRLKPQDRVLVIAFDDRLDVLAEPTSDRAALTKAIRRARSGGGTRLYDAVEFVINKRLKNIDGRKAVVLFTDGVDTSSRRATYESTVRQAEESDALIYPVSYAALGAGLRGITPPTFPTPGGRGGVRIGSPFPRTGGGGVSRAEYERGNAYLHELARKTGGRLYRGDSLSNIAQAFEWVAEELRRQYSLGYYPKSAAQEGQRRQIKVRVDRPNLVVLSRDSYIYSRKKADAKEAGGQQLTETEAQTKHLVGIR
jgi:Ca-activated chloride channel homolog